VLQVLHAWIPADAIDPDLAAQRHSATANSVIYLMEGHDVVQKYMVCCAGWPLLSSAVPWHLPHERNQIVAEVMLHLALDRPSSNSIHSTLQRGVRLCSENGVTRALTQSQVLDSWSLLRLPLVADPFPPPVSIDAGAEPAEPLRGH